MKPVKYLLIGGGMASQRAAGAIRSADAAGEILMVCAEPHTPYDRPPLSKYYMRGEQDIDSLPYQPATWYKENRVELLLGTSAVALDAAAHTATLSNGEVVKYAKCMLATGGAPRKLTIPGGDLPGVYYFRTVDDATAVAKAAAPGKRAVIIGGGFIGVELAASLTQRGVSVTLLERNKYIWSHFVHEDMGRFIMDYCTLKGVRFLTEQQAVVIAGDGRAEVVVTAKGDRLECDFVVAAVGVTPNVELARQAGLTLGNGVSVDDHCRTSDADIYAAGDIIEFTDPYSGELRRVEHWGNADYSGTLAGKNMAGGDEKYNLLNYVWSDIFEMHLEFAGDERKHDRILIRGKMGQGPFAVLYIQGNKLTAFFAIDMKKKQFQPIQRLIEQRKDITGKDAILMDPEASLEGL